MKLLGRVLTGCTAGVAAADARTAAAMKAAQEAPACLVVHAEAPALPPAPAPARHIPPAHRAILKAAEEGTSIASTGLRGGANDPWYVQEMADHLCREYGYTYRKADIGSRPADD